jgi:hypothetical protein
MLKSKGKESPANSVVLEKWKMYAEIKNLINVLKYN